jgi:hypothetical protein
VPLTQREARASTDLPEAELRRYHSSQTEPDDFGANVTFPSFGGEPVKAWLRLPGTAAGPLPAVVQYVGYGGGRGLGWRTRSGRPPTTPTSRWTRAGRARTGWVRPSCRSTVISFPN